METRADNVVICQMLEVEKNACQLIEEAKYEANKLIKKAREKAKGIIEETRAQICNMTDSFEKGLQEEAQRQVDQIIAKKQTVLEGIEKQGKLKGELALKKMRTFLFESLLGEL